MSRLSQPWRKWALAAAMAMACNARFAGANVPAPAVRTPGHPARTGAYPITIPQRCAESAIPAIMSRLALGGTQGVKRSEPEQDYDLAKESFQIYVPGGYTGQKPYGLIVWINAGPDGDAPETWRGVLERHKLIWVGADNSGNNRPGWIRLGMALDAAKHMPTAYNIDAERVYVSGASGGGRCASMLGIAYPEFFTGGSYPIIGCNFYRRVDVTAPTVGRPAEFYQASFRRPSGKLWGLVRNERRHVFLTGETDANRQQTELNYKAAKKDGFRHVTYIEVPGMGHTSPDVEWFEKGIIALDEGRPAVIAAVKAATAPKAAPPKRAKAAPVTPKRETATEDVAPSPEEEAEKLFKLAKLYTENRMYNKAREKLKQLLKDHPKSAHVMEAEKLLKEMGKG